jgi:hypothetical protein
MNEHPIANRALQAPFLNDDRQARYRSARSDGARSRIEVLEAMAREAEEDIERLKSRSGVSGS